MRGLLGSTLVILVTGAAVLSGGAPAAAAVGRGCEVTALVERCAFFNARSTGHGYFRYSTEILIRRSGVRTKIAWWRLERRTQHGWTKVTSSTAGIWSSGSSSATAAFRCGRIRPDDYRVTAKHYWTSPSGRQYAGRVHSEVKQKRSFC